jgi:hypothetical protein
VLRVHLISSGRRARKLPGGHEKLAEELGTLEVFKPSKVTGELHRFLQGVQKGVSRTT